MKRILIVEAGGHGRSVAEAVAIGSEFSVAGFLDDAHPGLVRVWELPVPGKVADFARYRVMTDYCFFRHGQQYASSTHACRTAGEGASW